MDLAKALADNQCTWTQGRQRRSTSWVMTDATSQSVGPATHRSNPRYLYCTRPVESRRIAAAWTSTRIQSELQDISPYKGAFTSHAQHKLNNQSKIAHCIAPAQAVRRGNRLLNRPATHGKSSVPSTSLRGTEGGTKREPSQSQQMFAALHKKSHRKFWGGNQTGTEGNQQQRSHWQTPPRSAAQSASTQSMPHIRSPRPHASVVSPLKPTRRPLYWYRRRLLDIAKLPPYPSPKKPTSSKRFTTAVCRLDTAHVISNADRAACTRGNRVNWAERHQ